MRSSANCVRRSALLLAGGLMVVLSAGAWSASAVTEGSKAAGLSSCVEPTPVMRRNHMEFLKHQRDETVHNGIRGAKHSLADCVDCHASADGAGKSLPINGEGEFCAGCHSYAAVSIDCFQCHRTVPRAQAGAAGLEPEQTPVANLPFDDLGERSAMFWMPAETLPAGADPGRN